MSCKFIICAPGRPNVNGPKRRSFIWNPTFNCYVHESRELSEQEFSACCEKVFKANADIRPYVRITQFSNGSVAAPDTTMVPAAEHAALKAKYAALQARIGETPAPVTTITASREIGLEDALAVVERLAPDRLRKQSKGRPAAPQRAMEVA